MTFGYLTSNYGSLARHAASVALTSAPIGLRPTPMREKGWSREFNDPVELPRGRKLVTLEDAGNYITKLPKAEHEAPVMTFTWKGYGDPRCGCRMGNLAG